MNNLKLITTETFNNLPCNFYRNINDDILLTREQIGQALEYTDPSKAIRKIHLKHKDRLDELCVRIKLGSTQNGANLSKSEEQERVYYTERGIMEICRWSRQKNANIFMDWIWDIVEKYRHNELMPDLSQITSTLTSTDYFQISHTELYKNLYNEMKNTYPDIDLNQAIDDYCYENHLDSCYTLEVIEHNLTLRKLFESVVNSLLTQYNLSDNHNINTIIPTIFNEVS